MEQIAQAARQLIYLAAAAVLIGQLPQKTGQGVAFICQLAAVGLLIGMLGRLLPA